jgi:hypothetical protein
LGMGMMGRSRGEGFGGCFDGRVDVSHRRVYLWVWGKDSSFNV